jgi:hypothetical protein
MISIAFVAQIGICKQSRSRYFTCNAHRGLLVLVARRRGWRKALRSVAGFVLVVISATRAIADGVKIVKKHAIFLAFR